MTFYLVDKKSGLRSNQVLENLKKEFKIQKAGFSGVLDSFASGLLIVATDNDTKFLDLFLNSSKTYTGTILFGQTTDTLDPEGKVLKIEKNFELNLEKIKKIVSEKFIGKIEQIPPKFSNIKLNGKRAHELSRNNESFKLKPVLREVYFFNVFNLRKNSIDFKIVVSSGTYIRSIARDLGIELGLSSMLTSLRRESIGNICVPNETSKLEREDLIPFKFINVTEAVMSSFLNGRTMNFLNQDENYIIKNNEKVLWVQKNQDGFYKLKKRID